jgi:hypothetical protein
MKHQTKRLLIAAASAFGVALVPWDVPSAVAGSNKGGIRLETRLSLGYDSNLLDLSDVERNSFPGGGDSTFFVVDRMSDQFLQGEIEVEWKSSRAVPARPDVRVGWQRRQYLHNAIKSEDHLVLGLQLQPLPSTSVDIEAGIRPQVYGRHRFDRDALPGEAQFRPEVHKRWDLDLSLEQALAGRTAVEILVEASTRRYEAPFQDRDRESFGLGGRVSHSFGEPVEVSAAVRNRGTWTRNDPWDPDDRSYRAWRASTDIRLRDLPLLEELHLGLDLEWRRFTTNNLDDQDHFRRRDQDGEVEVETVRRVTSSLDWVSRAAWQWRSSDFPTDVLDEDGPFGDTVLRTGVVWQWEQP